MTIVTVNRNGDPIVGGDAGVWKTPQVFERGDHVYMTAPVSPFTPTNEQIEELAFASQIKQLAPNDNIMWLRGQYVEADNPNKNGAQWRAGELAIKSLTPMLMPITVMHDPRTAVGTIADAQLMTPEKDGVPRARIDTILAIWAHRFPDVADEVAHNAEQGTLMQSMECISPWYECSECGMSFQKLPRGAERANWCPHLKASDPTAGYVDTAAQSSNASRILGDVCFTGTGLIFGSRGAVGAYTEAHLEVFQEEVAAHHSQVHFSGTSTGAHTKMGLVQIEESELAILRTERDGAKSELAQAQAAKEAAEKAAEEAEAAKVKAEQERDEKAQKVSTLEAEKAQAALKDDRLAKLGAGFVAKINGAPTIKARLDEQAGTMSDEEWTARLEEIETLTGVKRDAAADGSSTTDDKDEHANDNKDDVFNVEELAKFTPGGAQPQGAPNDVQRGAVVGKLGSIFAGNGNGAKA